MFPMLWEVLASARERLVSSLELRGLLAKGLLVEMLVGWVKGRLEVLPEQDTHHTGVVQPAAGTGTASWSHENLFRFGTIGSVQSDSVKC